MNQNKLFNSKTDPIPGIRRELEIIPLQENGDSYLYFHDPRGYSTKNLALHRQIESLLSLIDGRKSIRDLKPYVGDDITGDQLLEFVRFLDENGLLNSQRLQSLAEETEASYEESRVHRSVTAGSSYPADPDELKSNLDDAFEQYKGSIRAESHTAKALYAPHIDPRVAMENYVSAFSPVKNLAPKRVVILATSHYAGLYPETYNNQPFIVVNKDFDLPLGTVPRDEKAINTIVEYNEESGTTIQDRAHRREHSIELHLLFLRYLWQHEFKVLPILIRGLDDLYYMSEGQLGKQLTAFSDKLNKLFGNDDETFFLISGDLAHFGKKFGDQQPASNMFQNVKEFDRKFLQHAADNHREKLLNLMTEDMDPYRICGFPPLYTFLQSMPDLKGTTLNYDLWDETERKSAVSYGSILYEKVPGNK